LKIAILLPPSLVIVNKNNSNSDTAWLA